MQYDLLLKISRYNFKRDLGNSGNLYTFVLVWLLSFLTSADEVPEKHGRELAWWLSEKCDIFVLIHFSDYL